MLLRTMRASAAIAYLAWFLSPSGRVIRRPCDCVFGNYAVKSDSGPSPDCRASPGYSAWRDQVELPMIGHRHGVSGDMRRRVTPKRPIKRPRPTTGSKARQAPVKPIFIGDWQEQLEQRTRERDEALEQQAATSEILHVISNSPTN